MEGDAKTLKSIDRVIEHMALAVVHYDEVFDYQFDYITDLVPVWNKDAMWENYYLPYCDELQDMWDWKRDQYLKSIR